MYKDKDKQREAGKKRSRRYREAINKAKGVTSEGVTVTKAESNVVKALHQGIHSNLRSDINPVPKRGKDIKCFGTGLPLSM